jgi:hypothetical protein
MVDVKATGRSLEQGPSPEQLRYARVLDYGMKSGLIALIAGFVAYLGDVLSPQVPFEMLPRLWSLSAADYVRESGMAEGWGWLGMLDKGDVLALSGIALLAAVSPLCLALLVPAYAKSGDRAYLAVTIALIGVLVLAASGILGSH